MYHMVKLLYLGCGQVGWERCLTSSVGLFSQSVHIHVFS